MHVGALIVDDEADIRTLLRLIIEAAGHGLFVAGEATNGQEALDRIDELDPQVVVLDEMMPLMKGLDAARRMRERRPGQIIILCTAYLDPSLQKQADEAGIQLCLRKEEFSVIPEALRVVQNLG
jgi:CheY-like chemotaxis protein